MISTFYGRDADRVALSATWRLVGSSGRRHEIPGPLLTTWRGSSSPPRNPPRLTSVSDLDPCASPTFGATIAV